MVVGTSVAVDLRILGIGARRQTASELAEQLFPWTWVFLGIVAITGFLYVAPSARLFFSSSFFFIKLLMPALSRAVRQQDVIDAQMLGTRLMIALEIHHARHGAYPSTLGGLDDDLLDKPFVDPMNDGPFVYRLLEGEAHGLPYVLYSTGYDGIDQHADQPIGDVVKAFTRAAFNIDEYDWLYSEVRERRVERED